MNVLVVGCGAIGRRHITNLLNIDTVERILIYTKVKDCLTYFDRKKSIASVHSLHEVKADFAIVANETCKHIETAIVLAEQGFDLFIEKPLSHNLERVDVLKEIVKQRNLKVFVAYNMRFLGALNAMKNLLTKKMIGQPYFAKIEVGQYLPSWRPGRDYRESYSAHSEKGGGVALDLSHELDYMRYLFGEPCCWKVLNTKVSDLEIDSADMFEGLFLYESGFVCNVHLDYLQMEKKRKIRIVGSEGVLVCDFVNQEMRIIKNNSEERIDDKSLFDLPGSYMSELHHFIDSIQNDTEPCITTDDGIKALKLLSDQECKGVFAQTHSIIH